MTYSINRHLQYDDPLARSITDVVYHYGEDSNVGIANRQQRALDICQHGHCDVESVTLNADGCPVVLSMTVRSGSDPTRHYRVTRIPNQQDYTCTCPDTWQPCKHSYGTSLLQTGFALAHTHRLTMTDYTDMLRRLGDTHPFGVHERAALEVIAASAVVYYLMLDRAAQSHYGATQSYRATCFSALVNKTRWHYGAGYSGIMVDNNGEISSVLAGRPTLPVRWHPTEMRWYIIGADDGEDPNLTQQVLQATLPEWAARWHVDPDESAPVTFEEEEEGHYALG